MPTYAYACTDCGHQFEARQSFTDDALTECPACGGRLRKQFGNVGVVFKGSGFYRTDSRSSSSSTVGSNASGDAASGSASGAGSAGSSTGSSDSGSSASSGGAAATTSKESSSAPAAKAG